MTAMRGLSVLTRHHSAPVHCLSLAAALAVVLSLGLAGCSTGSGPSGSDDDDDDDGPGCVVFVDDGYVGEELGTQDQPFNTIDEGVAAADSGCTVRLAAGTYATTRANVVVPHLVSFAGAGRDQTRIDAGLELAMFTPPEPVRVCSLSFENLTFGYTPDTTAYSYAPVTISDCRVDALVETINFFGPSAPLRLINCEVDGDINMAEREVHSARTVRGCTVGGDIAISQVSGDTMAVLNATVAGDVSLWTVAGDRQTVSGCDVGGSVKIRGVSVDTQEIQGSTVGGDSLYTWCVASDRTRITGNTVQNARLECTGASAADVVIDDNVLTGRGIRLLARATYGSVSGNVVNLGRSGEAGIKVRSLAADIDIEDNTVTLPYASPSGTPAEKDTLAPAGILVISRSGPWVRDNDITGGTYGIYCTSYSTEVKGNDVTGAHTGIFASAASCSLGGNTVTGCQGDGFHFGSSPDTFDGMAVYRMTGNTSSGNGGAGVRANGYTLMETGPGRTGNTLTGNSDYDLLVETAAAVVGTLLAGGNYWDHSTVADVDEFDVWDGKDDPSLATFLLEPLGSGGGAW